MAYAPKYALSTIAVEALETFSPWATFGSATVISVPSSWRSAAAPVHAASRSHAARGTSGRGLSVREWLQLDDRPDQRIVNGAVLHYTRVNPQDPNVVASRLTKWLSGVSKNNQFSYMPSPRLPIVLPVLGGY